MVSLSSARHLNSQPYLENRFIQDSQSCLVQQSMKIREQHKKGLINEISMQTFQLLKGMGTKTNQKFFCKITTASALLLTRPADVALPRITAKAARAGEETNYCSMHLVSRLPRRTAEKLFRKSRRDDSNRRARQCEHRSLWRRSAAPAPALHRSDPVEEARRSHSNSRSPKGDAVESFKKNT